MLSICCEFGDNCNIVFNPKTTVCIKFDDKVNEFENVYRNNTLVQWANEVKHLGNMCNLLSAMMVIADLNAQCSLVILIS